MMFGLLLAAMMTMPHVDNGCEDRVDVLEKNHVYDDCGREVLVQLIGWDKSDAPSGFSVVFWRLMKDDNRGMEPQFSYATQTYVSEWHDGDVLRRVKARKRWERHLQYDVETHDRGILAKESRRELTKPDTHFQPRTEFDSPSAEDLEP